VHAEHGAALPLRRRRRISGPIMDRIDIHLDVRRVPFEKLASLEGGERSKVIRARVEAARKVQEARFAPWARPTCSSTAIWVAHLWAWPAPLSSSGASNEVQQFCQIDADGKELMRTAVRQLELSARSYHRVLKLARTIADLTSEGAIRTEHLAAALQYRPRGRV
jgi:magnesium chelatase family protein